MVSTLLFDLADQVGTCHGVSFLHAKLSDFAGMRCADNHFHLHGAHDGYWVALLDVTTILNPDFDQYTSNWRSDLATVAWVCLWPGCVLHSCMLVVNRDLSYFAVQLVESGGNSQQNTYVQNGGQMKLTLLSVRFRRLAVR